MKGTVAIDTQVCKGCGLCVSVCPAKVLALDANAVNAKGYHPSSVRDPKGCIACAMCATVCPDSAIRVEKEDE